MFGMTSEPIDILGLTFEEAKPPAGPGEAALRPRYRRTLTTGDNHPPFIARVAPVIRHERDGELIKFIQSHDHGLETESVIIPMGQGDRSWYSLCVSSQVGCRMGCSFCETAQLGLLRNLSASEIVGQVLAARREFGVEIKKIVFMGMGEPFDNFDAVVQAVRVLTDPAGLSLSKRQITISTVGRIDGIRRLASMGWQYLQLAVSLNAPNDEIRSRIMPVNRADNMAALRDALTAYPLRRNMFIMIEYVLIPGLNDSPAHARELADYLRSVKCCVNVIPYNPRRESPWPAPSEDSIGCFLSALREAGQFCKRRITRGRDLMAACGQLGNRALSRKRPIAVGLPASTESQS
ncbi:MAG: 23S rRNA (adenine(2503)-C(2))-methyltransferase RlmN [Phycisphaerae bacterium]|nr:23S rRNA (adenine(2503)-C(2))-methyltransferase RlmN [Phycisphaerae bacterium]